MTEAITQRRAQERLALLHLIGINAAIVNADREVLGTTDAGSFACLRPPLAVHNGRLMVERSADQRCLTEAINTVLQFGLGSRKIVPIGPEHFLTLIHDALDHEPAVVIIIADRCLDGRICPECLQDGFDLTAREAALAALLATGHPLKEAAAALQISRATARTHLRHIFQKIGVQTQSGLIALIAGCTFGRCQPPEKLTEDRTPPRTCVIMFPI